MGLLCGFKRLLCVCVWGGGGLLFGFKGFLCVGGWGGGGHLRYSRSLTSYMYYHITDHYVLRYKLKSQDTQCGDMSTVAPFSDETLSL